MSFTYIQFESPKSEVSKQESSKFKDWVINAITKTLTLIPKANPDFDHLIDQVTHWLVEVNKEGIPEREVGLSSDGEPIMKMPWNENYGYWTDNNLKLADFRNLFKASELSHEEFKFSWYKFGKLGCSNCFHAEIIEFLDQRTWLVFDLELTKKLGRNQMKRAKSVHDGIPDKDGEFTIYKCRNCGTEWRLKEPYDRGGGYFKIA